MMTLTAHGGSLLPRGGSCAPARPTPCPCPSSSTDLRRSDRVNSLHGAVGLGCTLGFWKILLHCVGFDGTRC